MINIGTIMKTYKNEVLVMTADLELIRVKKKPEMFQGLQIGFGDSDIIKPVSNKYIFFAAGIAAVLILAVFTIYNAGLNRENNGYAFIDMDINPSIEFMIDEKDIVQKILPLNSDAENLTKVLALKNLPVNEAVKKVIDRSKKSGILNSNIDNVIMISASLNPESSDYKVRRHEVEIKLNQLLASLEAIDDTGLNKKYSIKVVKVEPEIKEQAKKNGLSAGRQLILKKAQSEGIDMTLDEAKSGSLSALMNKVGIDNQNIEKEPLRSSAVQSTERSLSVKATPDKEASAIKPTNVKINSAVKPTPEKAAADVKSTSYNKAATPAIIPTPVSESIGPIDTIEPDSSKGSIKIQYYSSSDNPGDVIQIRSVFKIVNTGNTTIDLKALNFRYYYTIDGEKTQSLGCWAQEDKSNITYRFVKMGRPVEKADYYLEIGFKDGQLEQGKDTAIVVWFNKDDWSIFKQDNDYSYNSSAKHEYFDWNYVTGYISGNLKWGTEPAN